MKIHGVRLMYFMLFDSLEAEFSPNINIIIGENSTGKTALLKALYAGTKSYIDAQTTQEEGSTAYADDIEKSQKYDIPVYWPHFLFPRLRGIFRPENDSLSRLVSSFSTVGSAYLSINFEDGKGFWSQFGGKSLNKRVPRLTPRDSGNIVYIPTGEMISHTENFASLYEEYRIPFDRTCYDLVRLLDRPQKRTLPDALQAVAKSLEKTIGGKVVQKGRVFYLLIDNDEKIEMSLISDGYRKLATLLALLQSGTLTDGSILFWDEPETNMNPRMVQTLVNALIAVAGAGVQVFVSTHDYFVQQYFGLAASYKEKYGEDAGKLDFRFFSLYREVVDKNIEPEKAEPEEENKEAVDDRMELDKEVPEPDNKPTSRVAIECAARLVDLEHNAVSMEYNALYYREMGLIYGKDT